MKNNKSITTSRGAIGEGIACAFLEKKGYTIVERNFRRPWGEIDIIAVKDGVMRFVEVKAVTADLTISRESDHLPEEQINPQKIRKIVRTAELYMQSKQDEREYQIDAVGVIMDLKTRKARCRLLEQIL